MKKQILMGGLMAVGIGLAVGAVASASQTNLQQNNQTQRQFNRFSQEDRQEHREKMQEILDNKDYQEFRDFIGDKPMANKITEENFDNFIEMHNLRMNGDMDSAKVIAEELGFKGFGNRGMKRGMHKGMSFEDKNSDGFCDNLDKK